MPGAGGSAGRPHRDRALLRQLRIGHALRALGFIALGYDICDGPDGDLLQPQVEAELVRLLKSCLVAVLCLGLDCSAWSRARRANFGPPPLRGDGPGEIMGLNGLAAGLVGERLGGKTGSWAAMIFAAGESIGIAAIMVCFECFCWPVY